MLANCCGTGRGTATGTGTGSDTGLIAGVVVGRASGAVTGLAVNRGAGAAGAVATVAGSVGVISAGDGVAFGVAVDFGLPALVGVGRLRSAEAVLATGALSGATARLSPSSITRVFNAETCSGNGRMLSGCSRYQCPMATKAQITASVRQFGRPLGAPLTPGDGECRSCEMFIRRLRRLMMAPSPKTRLTLKRASARLHHETCHLQRRLPRRPVAGGFA